MTGLIEMVRMKGGIDSVDESLQMKIYRYGESQLTFVALN